MGKIQELVNQDGTRIGSDNVKLSVDNSKSASNSTLDPMFDQDGNQLKNASVQSTRQQGYRGYYSLVPMPSVKSSAPIVSYMSDEESNKKSEKYQNTKKLKRSSKKKMEEMVEDIMTSKKFPKDILDKFKEKVDLDKNGIPDIDIVSEENPILVRKLKNLMDIIQKNQASGEQKGIILNFLINNIDTTDIPVDYKNQIKNSIR